MKSCKAVYSISTAVLWVVLAVTGTSAVWAQARTTPVEVRNQVGLDAANNTVKAQQSGSWTVNVAGTLAATQSGIWNVGITGTPAVAQSGAWNVGITGTPNVNVVNTPNVNVANTPTVNISSANNTVAAATPWQKVQLWTTDQVLANGQFTTSPNIQTAGYKEIRACIGANSSSASLTVQVWAKTGTGAYTYVATGNFATPANFISDNSNFSCPAGRSIFSFPVLSDVMNIVVSNGTGGGVTVYNWSWVYLVN